MDIREHIIPYLSLYRNLFIEKVARLDVMQEVVQMISDKSHLTSSG